MEIREKLKSRSAVIGVVGLGYVGLPLVLGYAEAGFSVVGFDIDPTKPEILLRGESYLKHIPTARVGALLAGGRFDATTDFSRVSEVDALILCVPTPLNHHREPDLRFVCDTLDTVVPHLAPGSAISLESTTYPGTTAEEVVPRLTARGLVPGESVYVIYSPEREDPGNKKFGATAIPKVVGGHTNECLEAGIALYGAAFEKVVPVSSTRVAELTKLLENIYRAVNIGLVNELKLVAEAMDIDIWEVIQAASTKPFGFTPFYPGPGLGGHCIPIDPFYLTWKAREYGVHTRFIELAGEINRAMPSHVVQKVILALNDTGKPVRGSRILLLGLAYKPGVDDTRESPAFPLMERLESLGATVDYHDPYLSKIPPTREHAEFTGRTRVELDRISEFDAVLLVTDHAEYREHDFSTISGPLIDTRNAISEAHRPGDYRKA